MESKEKAGTGLTGPANFILFHTYICRPIRHSKVTNALKNLVKPYFLGHKY
nr:MAG TPA: hypothetical protein [Caudoviricetes sp.]